MDHVQWLLVGAGDISQKRVAAALTCARNSRLLAICSRQKEKARSLAERFGINQVYDDFAEAVTRCSADAVYLATPVALHVPQAVQALEAKKYVLIEKPLGLNAAECLKILASAQRSGKFAGCA